ncbi:VWA domain-containing protein [Permianibacter sp. IMCC34836]|uniref:vWA domain-containing protein n=1 Tax=Permianibacter fluminis TaxID=2738515 RepID=UPI0015573519|nr:VWA domain-containing protein [Permianibacter fluminis]NQD38594.1 VWA domain-containing protein [Permianibacter fluminis]
MKWKLSAQLKIGLASACFTVLLAACAGKQDPSAAQEQRRQQQQQDEEQRIEVTGSRIAAAEMAATSQRATAKASPVAMMLAPPPAQPENRENYQKLADNPVKVTSREPVSTFSIDVDTGAYSNMRRFLRAGQLPPEDAIRVEELINYFPYADSVQKSPHPFTVQTELAPSPWQTGNQLLRVRIKATDDKTGTMPASNLVFLVDVSGSMDSPDKLPMVQATLKMLARQLRPQDRIALVVYAGRTQVELESTPGNQQDKILAAIDRLTAGGSTAGEAAMTLAYQQARAGFIKDGINRILMATDGDFNVGLSNVDTLKDMIERERKSGVSLTMLGFGTGNYNDYLMEQLADVGNGNFAYIDSVDEGRKVLVDEMRSTLNTVAADVKLQIEFNPAQIAEYRLIGYENRMLNEEDFNNDKIDAGEIGAGKTVTALYELTPVGGKTLTEPRRYGNATETRTSNETTFSNELAFLRIRYKPPGASDSQLLTQPITANQLKPALTSASADFRFAASVAAFGQLLRGGKYLAKFGYDDVLALAQSGLDNDEGGYRREFVRLVQIARELSPQAPAGQ